MSDEIERGPTPERPVSKRVFDVITDLQKGAVIPRDRADLRRALDRADTPLVGRAAGDAAIGGMTRPTPRADTP
jgi:hypothetical protein